MHTILVADDDAGILESTQLLLEYEGYTVTTASDGDGVLNLNKPLPDLILLDIWLSGSNGGEITKYLKSQPKTKDIPIILFSANRDVEKIAVESGADDFIVKPFNFNVLKAKIQKHLK